MTLLSPYEESAVVEIRNHKRRALDHSPRRILPAAAREKMTNSAEAVTKRARSIPGAEAAAARVGAAYGSAAEGLSKLLSKAGSRSLSEARVLGAYKRHGHPVDSLENIRELDLHIVEKLVRPKRFELAYASAAAVEGALTGGVISGGEALAAVGSVAGVGAGGAPGFGTVAGAMGADLAFVLTAGSRAVAHTAIYYGYDPTDPGEQLFMMAVINVGSATTAGAKYAAYAELSKLAQGLARRATWAALDKHLLTRVANKFASGMSVRLTQRKLGQLIPIAGILVGAGLNFQLLDGICDAAYWAYRERFLLNKGAEPASMTIPKPTNDTATNDSIAGTEEVHLSVIEIVDSVTQSPDDASDDDPPITGSDDPR
jgi:hypothetical protein